MTAVPYGTICADPPWQLSNARIGRGGRRSNETRVPYSFMSTDAIAALPVRELAAPDCALFLWSTRKVFREGEAARVARAWGFEPCGEIIWGLRNPGTGSRTFANDHEPVLVARRGCPRIESDSPIGVWFWRQVYEYGPAGVPQKKHSAKPPGFLELIERICDGPFLELFAREARLGWEAWGHEALNHVDLLAETS
ncbi:MAG: S-adenosylmethionine-binding domain-containing protein [Gemmatimonadaceae bacterium]|nr:S-adenosylmethionine-binding domain-containing protein [Gemmatimonadaceae bacterium]